jgi:hypothetical protein
MKSWRYKHLGRQMSTLASVNPPTSGKEIAEDCEG